MRLRTDCESAGLDSLEPDSITRMTAFCFSSPALPYTRSAHRRNSGSRFPTSFVRRANRGGTALSKRCSKPRTRRSPQLPRAAVKRQLPRPAAAVAIADEKSAALLRFHFPRPGSSFTAPESELSPAAQAPGSRPVTSSSLQCRLLYFHTSRGYLRRPDERRYDVHVAEKHCRISQFLLKVSSTHENGWPGSLTGGFPCIRRSATSPRSSDMTAAEIG